MSQEEKSRVRISPETKKCLEQIAREHGCLYGGKPHVGKLLAQIELGRLVINKAILNRNNVSDNSTIGFRIEVPRYLKGTIAIISKKIADHNGNITAVKTRSRNNLGILQVFLSFPPEYNLKNLITELESIKINELAPLNEKSELKSIAYQFESELVGRTSVISLDNFLEKKLIHDMACVIGFQLIARDKVGLLAEIANQIAKARLLIYSVSEYVGENIDEAIIKLFLYLRPTAESCIAEQIKKIDDLIKDLKKIDEVKDINPLGVDSLD